MAESYADTMRDPVLQEMRDTFQYDESQWEDIRSEGNTDMLYLSGDPWPAADQEQRKKAGRPCLSLDELNQYVNQLVNDIRANKRAIKERENLPRLRPVRYVEKAPDGSDDPTAHALRLGGAPQEPPVF